VSFEIEQKMYVRSQEKEELIRIQFTSRGQRAEPEGRELRAKPKGSLAGQGRAESESRRGHGIRAGHKEGQGQARAGHRAIVDKFEGRQRQRQGRARQGRAGRAGQGCQGRAGPHGLFPAHLVQDATGTLWRRVSGRAVKKTRGEEENNNG
jgi:hypothetical protein